MSDREYIEKNLKFSKNVMGMWQATFVCADGYCCSVAGSKNAKEKNALVEPLIRGVISSGHPVQ